MSLELTLPEAKVGEFLAVLCAAGGSTRKAAKQLGERGEDVRPKELEALRDHHSGLYLAIAAEQTRAQEEAIAQEFREIVQGSNRLTRAFVDELAERVENGDIPRDLPQVVQALAKVTQVSTDKLLALTGRPVNGQTNDPQLSAQKLMEMGVLVAKHPPIDSTAEEVDEGCVHE
jgi:hypothetical protein